MELKLKNNFKKGDVLPVSVQDGKIILHSILTKNTLNITSLLNASDVKLIKHIGEAIGIVKSRDIINICCYANLHVHSNKSLLDGLSRINDIAKKSSGITALTDHGNMFGMLKWQKAMVKEGKKPIFGIEAYVETVKREKNSNHLILLAKNEIGLKNIFMLSSNSFNNFYKKPHISFNDLMLYHEGIVCTSACLGGEIASIIATDDTKAKEVATIYKNIFFDDFYLEVQRHNLEEERVVNPLIFKLSKELDIKVICANDSHYIEKDDKAYHDALLCINSKKLLSDENRFRLKGDGYHYKTDEEIINDWWDIPAVIRNTLEIAKKCNLLIETGTYHLPEFPLPEGYSSEDEYLCYLIDEGFKKRYFNTPKYSDPEYINRLKYEKSVLFSMGYSSYFLIVWDYVSQAKKRNILVGPGRGSAAGSLVAYCLEITDLDPIEHSLLFERFLNPDRISMPDIDIDFEDSRRGEVINYVKEKYGAERVCNIITFGRMQAKNAIKDSARILGASPTGDLICKKIPSTSKNLTEALQTPDLTALYEHDANAKNIIDIALKLEGTPRQTSTHACGIVVADKPIKNYLPTAMVKDSNSDDKDAKTSASQVTMTEVEELGLLKMDFLGLKTLSVIGESIKTINEIRKRNNEPIINYYRELPLNDPYVYADISKGKSFAVFQIESEGMRSFMSNLFTDVKHLICNIEAEYGLTGFGINVTGSGNDIEGYTKKMTSLGNELFERLVAGISLYRPGPMDYIPEYLKGMSKPQEIAYDIPSLKPILESTYGVIVYQEQVMQIVRELAGFSSGQADTVRSAMGKKKQYILDEYKPYFIYGSGEAVDSVTQKKLNIKGCVANGISEQVALSIWDKMSDFAKYAFNKSHAAVYAVLTISCAWLKYYYKVPYMSSMINTYIDNSNKFKAYISVAKKFGIKILPPSINESQELFFSDNDSIRFGLKGLSGLSKTVSSIVEERNTNGKFKSLCDFIKRTASLKVSASSIKALIYSGAFDEFPYSRKAMINSVDSIKKSIQKNAKMEGQLSFFDTVFTEYEEYIVIDSPEFPKAEKLSYEKEYSGMYISEHPLDEYEKYTKESSQIGLLTDDSGNVFTGKTSISGIINSVSVKYTKKDNRPMAIIELEDSSGSIKGVLFPNDYESYSQLLNKETCVLVSGEIVEDENFGMQILINSISDLAKVKESKEISKVFIRLDNTQTLNEISNLLTANPGDIPVYAQINKSLLNTTYKVSPTSALFMCLQDNLGVENVKYQ